MKYFLIDREGMNLLAVGGQELLNDLWRIQYTHLATVMCPDSVQALQEFTFLELGLLAEHVTGVKPNMTYSGLVSVVYDILGRVDVTHKNEDGQWLKCQADWIDQHDPEREHEYVYTHRQMTPGRTLDMEPRSLRTTPAAPGLPVLGQFAHQPHRPHVVNSSDIRTAALPQADGATDQGVQQAEPRKRAPAAPREPGQPRGSVSATIWQVADVAWEAAGKPTDKGLVLKLRKSVMDELESQHAVKRNSASNELGNWQKARIN